MVKPYTLVTLNFSLLFLVLHNPVLPCLPHLSHLHSLRQAVPFQDTTDLFSDLTPIKFSKLLQHDDSAKSIWWLCLNLYFMELESKPFSPASREGFIQTHSINLSSQIAPTPLLTKNSLYFTYSSALNCNHFSESCVWAWVLPYPIQKYKCSPGLARCLYPTLLQFCTCQETHGNTMAQPVTQKEAEEDIWEITGYIPAN